MNDYRGTLVLVVDDDERSRAVVGRILEAAGYVCGFAGSVPEARAAMATVLYPVVLCDVSMPDESGLDLIEGLHSRLPETAVVMMSGHDDPTIASVAVELGAYGYLVKPFSSNELRMTLDNALNRRQLELESLAINQTLQSQVAARTEELTRALADLGQSQLEVIRRLARAVEQRDSDTGSHIERIGELSAALAAACGLAAERVELIRIASPMHDVGKLGISDAILLKPGPLTPAERLEMQRHARIGHEILSGSGEELLETAAAIALSHHERWDGSGYPLGLSGDEIPLEGRIVAVADVSDALTSDRVYRPAMSHTEAMRLITESAGSHLDPTVVAVLERSLDTVASV